MTAESSSPPTGPTTRQTCIVFVGFMILLSVSRFGLARALRAGWPTNVADAVATYGPPLLLLLMLGLLVSDRNLRKRSLIAFGAAYLLQLLLTFAKVA